MKTNRTHTTGSGSPRAFTLIELLVVIAIIALLIGILLPALGRARQSGRDLVCQTNIRSLTQAMLLYANDNDDFFPSNNVGSTPDEPQVSWYDRATIEPYIGQFQSVENLQNDTVGGAIYVCPNHPDGARSYTMNYWASSNIAAAPQRSNGKGFRAFADRGSSMMLLTGGWSRASSVDPVTDETTYLTVSSVGSKGLPGERFGGIIGSNRDLEADVAPLRNSPESPGSGRNAAKVTSYIPYYRHGTDRDDVTTLDGRGHFGFLDGHVAGHVGTTLFEPGTGRSTFKVLWSPIDERVDPDEREG